MCKGAFEFFCVLVSYDYLKKNFFDGPPTLQGGYFKEFWYFFVILSFKCIRKVKKGKFCLKLVVSE